MTMLRPFETRYDAIVVGARCAGAATAMLLARGGAKVLVIDRDGPGTDTMSTHALMRGAVMQLARWGVLGQIVAAGTPAIRRTTFQYGAERIGLDIKPEHGVDALYAPRRRVIDGALAAAARAAGADIRFGHTFDDVIADRQGRVTGARILGPGGAVHDIRADLVIGADGRRSRVARKVAAATERQARHATACVYGYFEGIEDTGTHWYYVPGGGAGKIPTNDGRHCVFASVPRARFLRDVRGAGADGGLARLAATFDPDFARQLGQARLVGRAVRFAGQAGHIRRSWGRGWALVGDAGYFKDPLTAHGITDALRDAEILARAVLDGRPGALAGYQYDRDALAADLFAVTERIAALDWSLDEIKALHLELNRVMKHEQEWMAGVFPAPALAA